MAMLVSGNYPVTEGLPWCNHLHNSIWNQVKAKAHSKHNIISCMHTCRKVQRSTRMPGGRKASLLVIIYLSFLDKILCAPKVYIEGAKIHFKTSKLGFPTAFFTIYLLISK